MLWGSVIVFGSVVFFFFSSRRRHTRLQGDWSSDVCSSDLGWKSNENMDFDFNDAHDIGPLTDRASDETIKARLRDRFSNARQAIVLVGAETKNLRKWVPWEIEISQKLDLPIIVANLDGKRRMNLDLCPASLRKWSRFI